MAEPARTLAGMTGRHAAANAAVSPTASRELWTVSVSHADGNTASAAAVSTGRRRRPRRPRRSSPRPSARPPATGDIAVDARASIDVEAARIAARSSSPGAIMQCRADRFPFCPLGAPRAVMGRSTILAAVGALLVTSPSPRRSPPDRSSGSGTRAHRGRGRWSARRRRLRRRRARRLPGAAGRRHDRAAVCVQADVGHSLAADYAVEPARSFAAELGYLTVGVPRRRLADRRRGGGDQRPGLALHGRPAPHGRSGVAGRRRRGAGARRRSPGRRRGRRRPAARRGDGAAGAVGVRRAGRGRRRGHDRDRPARAARSPGCRSRSPPAAWSAVAVTGPDGRASAAVPPDVASIDGHGRRDPAAPSRSSPRVPAPGHGRPAERAHGDGGLAAADDHDHHDHHRPRRTTTTPRTADRRPRPPPTTTTTTADHDDRRRRRRPTAPDHDHHDHHDHRRHHDHDHRPTSRPRHHLARRRPPSPARRRCPARAGGHGGWCGSARSCSPSAPGPCCVAAPRRRARWR